MLQEGPLATTVPCRLLRRLPVPVNPIASRIVPARFPCQGSGIKTMFQAGIVTVLARQPVAPPCPSAARSRKVRPAVQHHRPRPARPPIPCRPSPCTDGRRPAPVLLAGFAGRHGLTAGCRGRKTAKRAATVTVSITRTIRRAATSAACTAGARVSPARAGAQLTWLTSTKAEPRTANTFCAEATGLSVA